MAGLNWYLTLRNLSKTDTKAKELFDLLQKAETDDEKEQAKEQAKAYTESVASAGNEEKDNDRDIVDTENPVLETEEEELVAEDSGVVEGQVADDSGVVPTIDNTDSGLVGKEEEKESLMDLSALAFTPRLAKCGITREEELFLKGVMVRKMTREEKILMRRSIYQKKTARNNIIQAEYRKKRLEQREKDLNDPEKQKFHQERKYVSAVVEALTNHKNMVYIFSQIDGLTPELLAELLKNPANANAIKSVRPTFIEDLKKKYGV